MAAVMKNPVNWEARDSSWFINPKASIDDLVEFDQAILSAPALAGHIWMQSSGSREGKKWLAISKRAFLASAEGVSQHLRLKPQDVWLKSLPDHHVGGMSIWARAHHARFEVVSLESWSASAFCKAVSDHEVSVSSLVPTQVYDLVVAREAAPPSLRAIVVGGDALSAELYQEARKLGWPLLPSYGSTETCSQIATADLGSLKGLQVPRLSVLPHAKVETTKRGTLKVYSECLYTGELKKDHKDSWVYQKRRQPYHLTSDLVSLEDSKITSVERPGDRIKVLGELVSLGHLREELSKTVLELGLEPSAFELIALSHSRKGQHVVLVSSRTASGAAATIRLFNSERIAPERIDTFYLVDQIPRSELGKLKLPNLLELIGRNSIGK